MQNLKCQHCKSENIIQKPIFKEIRFGPLRFKKVQLIQRRCFTCNHWSHVMPNGKSPEHIKKMFREFFETQSMLVGKQ